MIKQKNKKTFYLRLSGGCLGVCTYCGIKDSIGRLKSKPIKTILEEFDNGLNKGYSYFDLQADDVAAYGLDIGLDFPTLLTEMLKRKGNYQFYVSNVYPLYLYKYRKTLFKIFKSNHFDKLEVPIQSGSNDLLKLMKRYPPKISQTVAMLKLIHKINPKIKLRSNFIIGFPGETDSDFKKTLRVIREVPFSEILVFRYLVVPNSESAKFKNKIKQSVISKRMCIFKNFANQSIKNVIEY